jgi:hypothetical protein
LFFLLMRYHGVHVLDFPHFLTTAHTEADVAMILEVLEKTCVELRASGFMPERTYPIETVNSTLNGQAQKPEERIVEGDEPPMKGAKLGRTPKGDAAWYVPDADRPGKFKILVQEEL